MRLLIRVAGSLQHHQPMRSYGNFLWSYVSPPRFAEVQVQVLDLASFLLLLCAELDTTNRAVVKEIRIGCVWCQSCHGFNIPVPRAETGGFCGSKENVSLFCHRADKFENFLKFLVTRANFSKFNPGDVSWIKPFQERPPGDFGTGIPQRIKIF